MAEIIGRSLQPFHFVGTETKQDLLWFELGQRPFLIPTAHPFVAGFENTQRPLRQAAGDESTAGFEIVIDCRNEPCRDRTGGGSDP